MPGAPPVPALIARELPPASSSALSDRAAREGLLRGAAAAGEALALAGLALGHAIAQALGSTFGLPHGAMNALALPLGAAFQRRTSCAGRGGALGAAIGAAGGSGRRRRAVSPGSAALEPAARLRHA